MGDSPSRRYPVAPDGDAGELAGRTRKEAVEQLTDARIVAASRGDAGTRPRVPAVGWSIWRQAFTEAGFRVVSLRAARLLLMKPSTV